MPLSLLRLLDRLFAATPEPRRLAWLGQWRYAHRGLHDGLSNGPVLENSIAAFDAAIAAGVGIECDVQRSSDNKPMVFHDYILERLTAATGTVASRTAADLKDIALRGSNGNIPELTGMLDHVQARVPVLIEIKADSSQVGGLCLGVRRALEGYGGKAAVMSFNPAVVAWFMRNAPHILRGLVISEQDDKGWIGRLKRHFMLWGSRPQFLAYDIRDLPSPFAAAQRERGIPVLTWTVRDDIQQETARLYADAPIFETAPVP
jgi:glycerophosphoryl diester phosphodiesterase